MTPHRTRRRVRWAGLAAFIATCVVLASPGFGPGAAAQSLAPLLPAETAPAATPGMAQTPVPLRSPDRAIARRLAGLYAEVEGLGGVKATVKSGVVNLSGSVLTEEDAKRAQDIAERVQGVVSVQSDLATERRIGRRLQPLFDRVAGLTQQSLSMAPLLFLAALVFLLFWYSGRRLTASTQIFKRVAPNAFVEALIKQFVRLTFIVSGLVAALSIVGATAFLGSILGAAGLLGLAVGFAVRDTIENYLAGILLSIRQPFAPNDHVVIEDFDGRITRLTSRVTVITTWDGNEVQIPNATVYKANITNFSKTVDRRFDFELPLDLTSDASCALAVTLGAIKGIERVLSDPAPSVVIDRIEGSALVVKAYGWIDQNRSDFGKVKSEAIRCAKGALESAGILLAVPVQTVRLVSRRDSNAAAEGASGRSGTLATLTPDEDDLRAIGDTSADDTISAKVHALRSDPDEKDLLSSNAEKPRRSSGG